MSVCDRYVYAIQEKYGRMIYVGVGKGDRWAHHLREARRGFVGKSNPAKAEYLILCLECGIELEIYKIAEHLTIDEACKLEIEVIELLGRRDLGTGPLFNANAGGFGSHDPSPTTRTRLAEAQRGKTHLPETRAKIAAAVRNRPPELRMKYAEAQRGQKRSPETRTRMSEAQRGHSVSVETRAKLAAAGSNISPETRTRMSVASRNRKSSPETRAKIAAAGRNRSAETRAKVAAALCGRECSPETRAKIGAALRHRPKSAEHRAKLSAATLKQWADRANVI